MGQTVSTVHKRAQGHWWARFKEDDAFHQALALDANPFAFVALPLEFIPTDAFIRPGLQRRVQVREFCGSGTG